MTKPKAVQPVRISEYLTPALNEYGTYVLCARAVGDTRDGLKPVQRRLLWEAYRQKAFHNANFKKSAKLVGGTMGNWHPHGDSYGTLVNMTKDRYPLFEGHGNFGTVTDGAASSRYTEARLTDFAERLFDNIEIAPLTDNYSGDQKEPVVLPARLPIALLNGFEGIAVGLRTSIPPHNLVELIQATKHLMQHKKATTKDLLQFLPGPDYGEGILVSSDEDILEVYESGKGALQYRCQYNFQQTEDHQTLEVTGLAPQFNVSKFLETCQGMAKEGHILYATDMSSSKGYRFVVGFTDSQVITDRVIPLLHTQVSYNFVSVVNAATVDESEIVFTPVLEILNKFLEFRRGIEDRILRLELQKLETQYHIEKIKALAIKKLNKVIRELKSLEPDLKGRIAEALKITREDAEIICHSRVQALAKLSEEEQLAKLAKIKAEIRNVKADLKHIDQVVLRRLQEMLEYGDERGTLIREDKPYLEQTLDVDRYVTATASGKLQRWFDPLTKTRGWHWDYLVEAGAFITVAFADGKMEQKSTSNLTTEDLKAKIVGIVSSNHEKMLLLCPDSAIVSIAHPQKIPKYPGTRSGRLKQVVGFNDDDLLALISNSYEVVLIPGHKLKGQQRGSSAKVRFRMRDIAQIVRIPPGGKLFDGMGNEVDLSVTEKKIRCMGPMFPVGVENFGLQNNRKAYMSLKKAVKLREVVTTLHIL